MAGVVVLSRGFMLVSIHPLRTKLLFVNSLRLVKQASIWARGTSGQKTYLAILTRQLGLAKPLIHAEASLLRPRVE